MTGAPIRIFGVGSPFGDDRLGWVAARRLRARLEVSSVRNDVEICELDRPGAALVFMLEGASVVVLIDAVHSGATPGTLHRIAATALDPIERPVSGHEFGVAPALQLARALGVLPAHTVVFGLEADPQYTGEEMSSGVHDKLGSVVDEVSELVAVWQAENVP